MTFAYVGYIWALLGCGFFVVFGVALGGGLYFVGKRMDRHRPRTVAVTVSGAPETRHDATDEPQGGDGA